LITRYVYRYNRVQNLYPNESNNRIGVHNEAIRKEKIWRTQLINIYNMDNVNPDVTSGEVNYYKEN
jgi:hypothetical protein